MDTTEITHLSLCSGYGGIDLGLNRVLPNLRTVAYAEIEAFACEVLLARMEGGQLDPAPIWSDLKSFPWEQFSGLVDILTGGYPCQPFSAAGKRLGADDERHLWPYIANGIRLLRPRVCFFENVEGHISLGLSTVISDLEELGYRATWGIFSASEVGAPHQRKRVFIMAHRSGEGLQGCGRFEQIRLSVRRKIEEGHSSKSSGFGSEIWPSRPGEPQHAWEPPRVVVDSQSQRAGGRQQLCDEDGRQGRTLPCESDDSGKSVGNAGRDGRRQDQPWRETEERVTADWASESVEHSNSDRRECNVPGNAPKQDSNREGNGVPSATVSMERNGRQTQPTLGGNADGAAGGLGYAELCVSCDNRTDELRLLGNGVVPATAEIAFKTLLAEVLQ